MTAPGFITVVLVAASLLATVAALRSRKPMPPPPEPRDTHPAPHDPPP